MIQFYHVYNSYLKDAAALTDVSLNIEKGEFVFLTGVSGAGKSTLLKLIFCGEQPTQGQILINQMNIARMNHSRIARIRRRMGVVFQDFKLLNTRTVGQNVQFPLEVSGIFGADAIKRVRVVLKNFGLEHKIGSKPLRLSGGEQQRVAIARAVVNDPMLLLADEPTGNLDADNTTAVMEILKNVNARGTTVVVATHDVNLVDRYARRVIRLEQGRVVAG